MVRLVDHLEGHDLLRRQRDPANRRRHLLTVTAAGRGVLADSTAFMSQVDARLSAVIGSGLTGPLDEALTALMGTLFQAR